MRYDARTYLLRRFAAQQRGTVAPAKRQTVAAIAPVLERFSEKNPFLLRRFVFASREARA